MTTYDFYLRQGKSQQGGEHIVFHILERMSRQFTNTAQQAGLIEAILDEHILQALVQLSGCKVTRMHCGHTFWQILCGLIPQLTLSAPRKLIWPNGGCVEGGWFSRQGVVHLETPIPEEFAIRNDHRYRQR